jgi:imidazolonepropionase-like amidohydrolase
MKPVFGVIIALLIGTNCDGVRAAAPDTPAANERVTLIYAGRLLAFPGQPPLTRQTVVVRDGLIVELRSGYTPAAAFANPTEIIDLSHQFVLPGLMDMHTHVTHVLDRPRPARIADEFTLSPAASALRASVSLHRILETGFTTIRDLGAPPEVIFPLRDALNSGEIEGPRLFAAGELLSVTGGHGDDALVLPIFKEVTPEISRPCDGVADCRRKTRDRIQLGADYIKIATSGSASDANGAADADPDIFPDELEAIVQTAALHRVPVAAHVTSTKAINLSVSFGVHTIEHGTYADAESFRLMKTKGAILVPTTYVVDFLDSPQIQAGLKPHEWEALSAAMKASRALPGKAYRAGVELAVGTDAGGEASARRWRELALYVESGVPASEAIKAATINAADVIGMKDKLGQIRGGFLADIIATPGDPLADIAALANVDFVMKGGKVIRTPPQTQ